MGTLVITIKENNTYKYAYNNYKGNTLFTSSSLKSKAQCFSEINILKNNFNVVQFVKFKTPSGKLFFKLELNGFILANSRKFTTPLLIEKGINDIKKNFLTSEVLDFTENIFGDITELEEIEEHSEKN